MANMKRYRYGIFDFEGTLVSFEWDIPKAVDEVKDRLKSRLTNDKINSINSYAELYNYISTEFPGHLHIVDEIYDKYDRYALEKWKVHSNGEDVLRMIVKNGVKLALVSNVGITALRSALKKFGLLQYFSCVISRNDVRLLKPEDEGLGKAVAYMKGEKSETLFIGDSVTDVMAGRKAGIDVAVVQGESGIEDLRRAGPAFILEDLSDAVPLFHG